jgi:hypothetical protein
MSGEARGVLVSCTSKQEKHLLHVKLYTSKQEKHLHVQLYVHTVTKCVTELHVYMSVTKKQHQTRRLV